MTLFQSPSLRGSGRFPLRMPFFSYGVVTFQSPSLRGSGRFDPFYWALSWFLEVSIPFIAGQWSLR